MNKKQFILLIILAIILGIIISQYMPKKISGTKVQQKRKTIQQTQKAPANKDQTKNKGLKILDYKIQFQK